MKRILTLLIALVAGATALKATAATTGSDLPGLEPQPASYFYTGKPYEQDVGAYTFRFRSYDPTLNRWSSTDPSGFSDGANSHLYVGNSILCWLDPDGLRRVEAWVQDTWDSVFSSLENWVRELLGAPEIAAAGHYLKLWGETNDDQSFYSWGWSSAEGQYTFSPPLTGYALNVHDPVVTTDSNGVQHITVTSEYRAYVGIDWQGVPLSFTIATSTLDLHIAANE